MSISPVRVESPHKSKSIAIHSKQSGSGVGDSGGNSKKRTHLELRDLLHWPLVHNKPFSQEQGSTNTACIDDFDDDVSTIHLVEDENDSSLQGHPGSRGSTELGSALSRETIVSSGHKSSSSVGDYKQNFPYEPPRQQLKIKREPLK